MFTVQGEWALRTPHDAAMKTSAIAYMALAQTRWVCPHEVFAAAGRAVWALAIAAFVIAANPPAVGRLLTAIARTPATGRLVDPVVEPAAAGTRAFVAPFLFQRVAEGADGSASARA